MFISNISSFHITVLGLPSIRPIPDVSQWDNHMMKDWLNEETTIFLKEIFGSTQISQDVIDLELAYQNGFQCRQEGCDRKFQLHSTRVRYYDVPLTMQYFTHQIEQTCKYINFTRRVELIQ